MHLNFKAQFMKDILFEKKKIKSLNKQHFVEKQNRDYAACLKMY